MVTLVDEKLRNMMTRDGSHLKHTRTIGGWGAGAIAGGACFIGIGVLFAAMMVMGDLVSFGLALGGVCIALGIILIIPGYYARKKRINDYMKYYQKESGYTEEALKEFDEEFQKGEAILISKRKRLNNIARRDAGIFTKNWFKFPFMLPMVYSGLYHVDDIVAIWYQATYVQIEYTWVKKGLIALDCHGKFIISHKYKEAMALEIIEQLVKRNPKVITSRKFSYQGVDYDVIQQPNEVVALYQSIQQAKAL